MKFIVFLIISFCSLSVNAQVEALKGKVSMDTKVRVRTVIDTVPKVVYPATNRAVKPPAYFIDGKHFDQSIIKTLNPQLIDSMYIEKKEMEIDGKEYYGQIYMKMKKEYKPKLISLTDLKLKYTTSKGIPAIFMIDNEIIKDDCNSFLVDETYLLKIVVENVKVKDENLHLDIIRLLTKTEANIQEANKIMIRGEAEEM